MAEMLDTSVLLWGAFSTDNWPQVRPLGKRALHPRLVRLMSFVVIVLLSLALWAAIWRAVALFA
jgi:hypothetical protein